MYRVKFFKEFSTGKLEKSINSFLEDQPKTFELKDIKYLYNDGNTKLFTAMVIYRIY